MGRLTTHVLNTAVGTLSRDLAVALFKIVDNQRQPIKSIHTNRDGRRDAPLSEGDALQTGVYGLDFNVGKYHRTADVKLPESASLDVVTLRLGMANINTYYHVPLLVSP